MRTRIKLLAILVAAVGAIAVVWKFPRTSRAAASSTVAPSERVSDTKPKAKPAAKNPAEGGKPSTACLECQKRECWNLIDGCSTLSGDAASGPSAGVPRKQLCEQMLECARSTGCDSPVSIGCYCGQTDVGSCLAGNAKGACRQAFEAAAESTDPSVVLKHLKDKSFASGVVEPLLTCETRGCPDDCVPYYR
jgi:hypothetical protein